MATQVFNILKSYAWNSVHKRRKLNADEIEEWVSVATAEIVEHLDCFDSSKGTLYTFVMNWCRYYEPVWVLQAQSNLSPAQARQLMNRTYQNNRDKVEAMFNVWSPCSVENAIDSTMGKTLNNDEETTLYDVFPDNSNSTMSINYYMALQELKSLIVNSKWRKKKKEMLLFWMGHNFDETKVMKAFNISRQRINYCVLELKNLFIKRVCS